MCVCVTRAGEAQNFFIWVNLVEGTLNAAPRQRRRVNNDFQTDSIGTKRTEEAPPIPTTITCPSPTCDFFRSIRSDNFLMTLNASEPAIPFFLHTVYTNNHLCGELHLYRLICSDRSSASPPKLYGSKTLQHSSLWKHKTGVLQRILTVAESQTQDCVTVGPHGGVEGATASRSRRAFMGCLPELVCTSAGFHSMTECPLKEH